MNPNKATLPQKCVQDLVKLGAKVHGRVITYLIDNKQDAETISNLMRMAGLKEVLLAQKANQFIVEATIPKN